MTENDRGFLFAAVYNLLIVAAIVVIVISGLLLDAGWYGLWSLLLLFSMASYKTDQKSAEKSTEPTT